MPERISKIDATTDPAVTKQYDTKTAVEEKFADFYSMADNIKICMFGTYRNGVGPIARSMGIAKRSGPDFLFLTNANSAKCADLSATKEVNLSFRDAKSEDWISITGKAVTVTNADPRIAEIYSKPVSAWFGDVGDGVHDGGPHDPRMTLVEVQSRHVTYWKRTTGALGFAKEIAGATMLGQVANTGDLRELHEEEIQQARERDSVMSSK